MLESRVRILLPTMCQKKHPIRPPINREPKTASAFPDKSGSLQQQWVVVGTIFKIGILDENNVACSSCKTCAQGLALATIS